MSRDFGEDVAIDKYNLIDELTEQPQLYYIWAAKQSKALSEVTSLKDKLDLIRSKVELKIRANPTLYRLPEKPTEGVIRARVNTDKKVVRANKRYLEAMRIENLFKKAERAFEHRKKSLEGLVSLNMQFWFSTPKTSSTLEQEKDQQNLIHRAREKQRSRKIRRRS